MHILHFKPNHVNKLVKSNLLNVAMKMEHEKIRTIHL